MYENHLNEISEVVKKIINKRGFFNNVEALTNILIPIKNAILNLESQNTNLADCYIQFLKVGIAINNLSNFDYSSFKNYCIKKYNERYILILN